MRQRLTAPICPAICGAVVGQPLNKRARQVAKANFKRTWTHSTAGTPSSPGRAILSAAVGQPLGEGPSQPSRSRPPGRILSHRPGHWSSACPPSAGQMSQPGVDAASVRRGVQQGFGAASSGPPSAREGHAGATGPGPRRRAILQLRPDKSWRIRPSSAGRVVQGGFKRGIEQAWASACGRRGRVSRRDFQMQLGQAWASGRARFPRVPQAVAEKRSKGVRTGPWAPRSSFPEPSLERRCKELSTQAPSSRARRRGPHLEEHLPEGSFSEALDEASTKSRSNGRGAVRELVDRFSGHMSTRSPAICPEGFGRLAHECLAAFVDVVPTRHRLHKRPQALVHRHLKQPWATPPPGQVLRHALGHASTRGSNLSRQGRSSALARRLLTTPQNYRN